MELGTCQQALKQAKAEGARRLRELTALQRQAEEGSRAAVPEAALEQERRSREAAEGQLREARQAVTRKTGLVKELRAKVGPLDGRCWVKHCNLHLPTCLPLFLVAVAACRESADEL